MTRGFTLIECLVYIALLTLLIISSHAALAAVTVSARQVQDEALLLREAMFLRELVRDEVREGAEVIEAGSGLLLETQEGVLLRFALHGTDLAYDVGGRSLALIAPPVEVSTFATQQSPSVEHRELEVAFELKSGELTRRFSYLLYL